MKELYKPGEVEWIIGSEYVKYKQLRDWGTDGFIEPSKRKGKYGLYTLKDIILLDFVRCLRERGYSTHKIKRMGIIEPVKESLSKIESPDLSILTHIINKKKANVILYTGDVLISPPVFIKKKHGFFYDKSLWTGPKPKKDYFIQYASHSLINKMNKKFPEQPEHLNNSPLNETIDNKVQVQTL